MPNDLATISVSVRSQTPAFSVIEGDTVTDDLEEEPKDGNGFHLLISGNSVFRWTGAVEDEVDAAEGALASDMFGGMVLLLLLLFDCFFKALSMIRFKFIAVQDPESADPANGRREGSSCWRSASTFSIGGSVSELDRLSKGGSWAGLELLLLVLEAEKIEEDRSRRMVLDCTKVFLF